MLVVKYERKNFFNERIYIEDKKENETLKDIKKAFQFLKNNYNVAIQIDNIVLYWNNLQDFEYKTLECREYDNANNYKEFAWDFNGCKNSFYRMYKRREE